MKSRQDALLDLLYGAVANPQKWPDALTRISDHLGAIGGMITHLPERGRPLSIIGRLSEELLEVNQRHYAWNPWSLSMKDVPFDKAVISNSLIDAGALARTGFYADILAPQGIVDALAISHASMAVGGGFGGFGFMLSSRGAEQVDENLRRLQRLTPHLGRALDATLKLGHLADGTRQLTRVLQLMPNPALLLDGKGRITLANPAAEALLRTGDGLTYHRNGGLGLAAALPSETASLSGALAQALAVASGTGTELGEPLRLSRPSGAAPLLVLPVPLPPPAFALWEMLEQARLLVLIVDPSAQSRPTTAIQTTFGLTAAEARVAALIGSGLSGPATAAMLGVSPSTVKTHLKRCFEKIGVHSQVGLVRILGALPIDPSANGRLN
jgi:DNA-binding CsgD family transcriptional regulator/PAS domain-containing protein